MTMEQSAAVPFPYRFPAVIMAWHDGDTATVQRGCLPGITQVGEKVRVEGMNAPELNTPEGKVSLAYVLKLVPVGTAVTLVSSRQEKYGRLLAVVLLPDGRDLAQVMIAAGQAVAYYG